MGFVDSTARGIARTGEVLFQYTVSDVEPGLRRPEIRHYKLTDGRLERTDPVALSPRRFAAFWLHGPWSEVSAWTDAAARPKLEKWHRENKGPFSKFDSPILHCSMRPDLWQLSAEMGETVPEQVYFLIRWRPPYRFTMMSVSAWPSEDCSEEDLDAEEERSLFEDR